MPQGVSQPAQAITHSSTQAFQGAMELERRHIRAEIRSGQEITRTVRVKYVPIALCCSDRLYEPTIVIENEQYKALFRRPTGKPVVLGKGGSSPGGSGHGRSCTRSDMRKYIPVFTVVTDCADEGIQ